MSLATIDIKPGFVDRNLISEQPAGGALTRIANTTPLDFVGREIQTVDFTGEMNIFGEGADNAADAEKKKTSNNVNNGKLTISPITLYVSYRFPKKFLKLFGVDNAYNPTDTIFRAGSPQTLLDQIMAQPYQAGILEQYRAYVNKLISRALDYLAIYGVNPGTKAASNVARVNGYLLDNAGAVTYTPGEGSEAAKAFKSAVRSVAAQGDTTAAGVTNAGFLSAIADGRTANDNLTDYASQIPLIGSLVNLGGVTLSSSDTVADTAAAEGSGKLDTTEVLDAIIGNFRDRFVWGAIPLSGIEVFDSGNPDNNTEGDLGAVNKVMLRTEVAIGWGFLGGSEKFRVIKHPKA